MIETQQEWRQLRVPADEDDSPIDLTLEGDYAQKVIGSIEIKSNDHNVITDNDIFIALAAGSAQNKTLTWRLFTWAKWNGMAQQVAYGVGTTGSQSVIKYPNGSLAADIYWCDTLVVTSYSWMKAVKATVGGGNNSVAVISLQTFAWPWWFLQIEDADGITGNEAGSVSAWWKRR